MPMPVFDEPHHTERLLTTLEVAAFLRIAPRTVCLWAECGELAAVRVGRQWRFRFDDVSRRITDGDAPIAQGLKARRATGG